MIVHGHIVGVCSWSLHPAGAEDLVAQMKKLGVNDVQIALGSLMTLDEADQQRDVKILLESGIAFTGGMIGFPGEDYSTIADIRRTGGIVPDATWPARKQLLQQAVKVAKQLGLTTIATHAGFIPPPNDPRAEAIGKRIGEVVAIFSQAGLRLLMETGQETAEELAGFLQMMNSATASPGAVGINFDPANMILYGAGDPIAAVGILKKWIGHVHVKDAVASKQPGKEWGTEVAFGTGQVGAKAFMQALKSAGYSGALAIEREAGTTRAADIATAIAALRSA